jgi:hypothetical protein
VSLLLLVGTAIISSALYNIQPHPPAATVMYQAGKEIQAERLMTDKLKAQ